MPSRKAASKGRPFSYQTMYLRRSYSVSNLFMRHCLLFIAVFVGVVFALGGCRKQRITSDPSAKLAFSVDTVQFDTVFTTLGSTTQLVKVYNRNNDAVVIDEVRLEGGSSSNFRINVDGSPGAVFSDIELRGGDSLWIFVEVTVDPNNQNSPFVIEDAIRFQTNGNEQAIRLMAWGQNAFYHGRPGRFTVLPCNEQWTAERPHLVFGIVAIDEGCNLTIGAGTQVHCYARSGIYVYRGGLDVQGNLGNEVVFQGSRLETAYDDIPGQWGIELDFEFEGDFGIETATIVRGGVWLVESTGSTIDYAIFKNGNIGIQVDTLGNPSVDALRITNTVVQNMGITGLLAQGASVSGWNNLFASAGQASAAFTIGGSYRFAYTTFANYWTDGVRQSPTFVLSNYYTDINDNLQIRPLTNTWFHNCIMWGNNASLSDYNEFLVDLQQEESQEYNFQFCSIDTDIDLTNPARYTGIVNGTVPPFIDPAMSDFKLSPNASTVWNGGFPVGDTWNPPTDLDQLPRSFPGRRGCYEGQ